ncbi:UNVERIFIED_CONTAM: hypothetical protein K2H54_043650 [Gekko kuhli]
MEKGLISMKSPHTGGFNCRIGESNSSTGGANGGSSSSDAEVWERAVCTRVDAEDRMFDADLFNPEGSASDADFDDEGAGTFICRANASEDFERVSEYIGFA